MVQSRRTFRANLLVVVANPVGEPLTLFLTEEEIAEECRRAGFKRWEFLDAGALSRRYFAGRTDGLGLVPGAARLTTAWK